MAIKTFIIEEHHEAFIVWNYAIKEGLIPPTGNTLFHVDEHSDMGIPRFNYNINELNGNISQLKDFVYNELNIGCFILPAAYKKIISNIYWIKQFHRKSDYPGDEMFIRSFNKGGKRLLMGKVDDIKEEELETFIADSDITSRIIQENMSFSL